MQVFQCYARFFSPSARTQLVISLFEEQSLVRHCEERNDEATQTSGQLVGCWVASLPCVALAMTVLRGLLLYLKMPLKALLFVRYSAFYCLLFLLCAPASAWASDGVGFSGASLSALWCIPFAGMLLSLALVPLMSPRLWHAHFGKIAAFWTFLLWIPGVYTFGGSVVTHAVLETLLHEYVPFMVLIGALFTATGGIYLQTSLRGTPWGNTGLMAVGTALASWIGTTGAAMLLVRPLIRANGWRSNKAHLKIFLIFLVANLGGVLTPLGDPPLFLGFLQGVDFFWTTHHLFCPLLIVALPLLALFFALDCWYYFKDKPALTPPYPSKGMRLEGWVNVLILLAVLGVIVGTGQLPTTPALSIMGVLWPCAHMVRDGALLGLAFLSWRWTRGDIRSANDFTWAPLLEVGKLFMAIFLTAVPVLAALGAGEAGPFYPMIQLMGTGAESNNALYFWFSGALSAFLDNAPTYLVFFHVAGGDAATLMGPGAQTLMAISAGAVFMGAMTYIGNAPNFMIKSIAEQQGIRMPSFFGFMGWSMCCLVPLFVLLNWVMF